MPELILELFSEEIPARMQERAAQDLKSIFDKMFYNIHPRATQVYSGPRRLALVTTVSPMTDGGEARERGPKEGANEQAVKGFLRKIKRSQEELVIEDGYWVFRYENPPIPTRDLLFYNIPSIINTFPWPKAMRWGHNVQSKGVTPFTWIRPLRRVLCVLDGSIVPFKVGPFGSEQDSIKASNITEGHRFLSPGAFEVANAEEWQTRLYAAYVVVDFTKRRRLISDGLEHVASEAGLSLVPDSGLLDEVAGLVEWPVALLGRIDEGFMDLPPEVMQVSMRVNQRYFALRDADGNAAGRFAFVANTPGRDGGAIIVAGNERVLRARFSDARHFWDGDRAMRLADRVAALDGVTFHGRLGTQGARARRLSRLAAAIAERIGADAELGARAGLLAKADLTSGMVGEFPELQGVMGGYYARHDGEAPAVAEAIAGHYGPRGPGDAVPEAPVAAAVALADKIDALVGFFAAGEKPGGSGDPYALRRAALGVIRIIRENRLRLDLHALFAEAAAGYPAPLSEAEDLLLLPGFIAERLRVQLRAEGARHDVLAAVSAAGHDPDLVRLLARTDAVAGLLGGEDGRNLLLAAKRAANILRIEEKKDGPHDAAPDPALLEQAEERALDAALGQAGERTRDAMAAERYGDAMAAMAGLRAPLDWFFDAVTVNAVEPALRRNRLRLLSRVRATLSQVADFTLIEG